MAARSRGTREPNERLRALLEEAEWSHAEVARQVNNRGAERGLDLRYDKTSVSRWLRGQHPRGSVPGVIAEALSRKLGREVTVDEIDMATGADRVNAAGLCFAPDLDSALEEASELWRSDARRRDFLSGSTVRAISLVACSRDWLITDADGAVARDRGRRVRDPDVEAVNAATGALVELDHRFGGGHMRPVVVQYLHGVVSGLLTGSYTDEVGRRLLAGAARLTVLAGYTAVDTGRPVLAQRYYIQALRLAQAADDRAYGGHVLSAGMSHLVASFGDPREAVQLARAAQAGTRGRAAPATLAMFYAAEARGHALLGDAQACEALAARAVTAFERGTLGDESASRRQRAYLADELAHCYRDLGRPGLAARWAEEALAGHDDTRVRRRVIDLLVLATAQVQLGEVERACRTARQAIQLLGRIRSHRGVEYLRGFQGYLRPFDRVAAVREFDAWLASVGCEITCSGR